MSMTSSRRTVLAGLAAAPFLACAAHAQARASLRVGYLPIIPMAQLFVMEGEGWTKAAGVDLTLTRFSSGPAMVQALASRSLDVAYVGIGPAMVARGRGIDLKVVAANIVDQVALLGRGALVQAFAAAPNAADAFQRFRASAGRAAVIATLPPGSVPDTVLRHYLQEVARVPAGLVEVRGVGEDQVQQLLLAGAVDAASILEPILTIVRERDPGARVIVPAAEMLPRQPGAVVAATAAALTRQRDAVARMVALHVRATKFVRDEPERATKHVVDFIGKGLVEPAVMRKALISDSTHLIADPRAIVESTRLLQDFQRRIGTQPVVVDIDALFDFSFYDAAVRAG
ncbi:MAG: ABC transporter substrate-binding protein [Alphaproteobacteria bacterium]|nr:ABC transporter substrate-binding protein [Alphaproteobacteria bacterium]